MKKSVILLMICFFGSVIYSYSQKAPLDGKSFTVDMYKENNLDKKEKVTLHFVKGKLDAEEYRVLGFKPTAYSANELAKGIFTWDANCTSLKEGTMSWSAKVKGDKIGGNVIWEKKGQSVTTYRFSGFANKK